MYQELGEMNCIHWTGWHPGSCEFAVCLREHPEWITSISRNGINFEARSSLTQSRDTEIAPRQARDIARVRREHRFANTFQWSKLLTRISVESVRSSSVPWKLRARAWNIGPLSPFRFPENRCWSSFIFHYKLHVYSEARAWIDEARQITENALLSMCYEKCFNSIPSLNFYKLKCMLLSLIKF